MRLASDVAGLVAGQKHGERGTLLRDTEPAHRLAIDKALTNLLARASGFLRQSCDALFERRRFDSAGANRVAADALLDEICCDRLGKADHRCFGGAIDGA